MVNFRLLEEEYEVLKKICLTEGARSISDFARAAVCDAMGTCSKPAAEPLDVWVRNLDARVQELECAVKRLTEGMEAALHTRSRNRMDVARSG